MPRQARVIVPGFPHHIVQRGHNWENRDRLILCTLVFCLGLSLSKMVFSNPLGLLFF
jgi:hypothetical protein